MPVMEKNGMVAIVASNATGEEAPIEASKAATVPVQTLVPAFAVAAGEEAPAGLWQIPHGWYPYEEEEYIRPENPYDTNISESWSEVDSDDVFINDESMDTKTRQVPRKPKSDQYDNLFAGDVYRCPFCTRSLATDFNSIVKHAEDVKTYNLSVNVHDFSAKHQVLGFHLRNLQKVAIEEGHMSPIKPKATKVKGLGSNKWRKCQREEAEALLAEAMRGY